MLVRLIELRISPAGITYLVALLNELSKLPDRDLGLPHVKGLRDLDFMLRTLTVQEIPDQAYVQGGHELLQFIIRVPEPEVDFLL